MIVYLDRCACVCGCQAVHEDEHVINTGCLACSEGCHDMHRVTDDSDKAQDIFHKIGLDNRYV